MMSKHNWQLHQFWIILYLYHKRVAIFLCYNVKFLGTWVTDAYLRACVVSVIPSIRLCLHHPSGPSEYQLPGSPSDVMDLLHS